RLSLKVWRCRPMWPSWSTPAGNWVPARPRGAAAAEVGTHARLWRPLLLQEPPLLHHLGGVAAGSGPLTPPPGPPRPTQTRRSPTTLGAWRRARVASAIRRRRGATLPLDVWGRPKEDQVVLVVASWAYLGSGYQTTGEAWLAASAAARAREARRVAKEGLRTTTMAA